MNLDQNDTSFSAYILCKGCTHTQACPYRMYSASANLIKEIKHTTQMNGQH